MIQASFPRRVKYLGVFILLTLLATFPILASAQDPLPQTPPQAAVGMGTFINRCASCHGPTGAGDGELADRLPTPPRAFTNPDFIRKAVPTSMLATIMNGNLDIGMPPFGPSTSNPVSTEQGWELIAAIYSMATPTESLARGETLYLATCAACHGESGGDEPAADLSSWAYWVDKSSDTVTNTLQGNTVAAHNHALETTELVDVTDYARSLSYVYFDPLAPLEPIETVNISGIVTNGSTSQPLAEGTAVLQAFTRDIEETLTLEMDLDGNGRFSFDLTDVPPDWVFITRIEYNGLPFRSVPQVLDPAQPTLDMPITVFDQTQDSAVISIEQVHFVLDFGAEQVQVSEVYIFNNASDTVFVGQTGDAADGTIKINLPAEAQQVTFQRGFGSLDNFFPTQDFVQTGNDWVDTVPLQPGRGAMNLLLTYLLPFDDGLTFSHVLNYETATASTILPEVGMQLEEGDWISEGAQSFGEGASFLSYTHPAVAAGETLNLTVNGRLNLVTDSQGRPTVVRNESSELTIGAGFLLIAAAGAVWLVRSWSDKAKGDAVRETAVADPNPNNLLQAVAQLDDNYENGTLDENDYAKQRTNLISQLVEQWESNE